MIADGLRGMTSNPTIFEHAIGHTSDYDQDMTALADSARTDRDIFETLAIEDVREAADVFRAVFDSTEGGDGFVSLEVSPQLARDTDGSVAEARRLWKALDRPNVMIKIPGTREGWPAIERCLSEGININITLLFSVEHYRAVAEAYLRALEARLERGQPIDRIASVASLFVSRVDTEVDERIRRHGGSLTALRGKVALASAHLAYAAFLEMARTDRWRALRGEGRQTAATALGQHRHQESGVLGRALCGLSDWSRHDYDRAAGDIAVVRGSRPGVADAGRRRRDGGKARDESARGRRDRLRGREPHAGRSWNREVHQVVRFTARCDRQQTPGAPGGVGLAATPYDVPLRADAE